MAAEGRPGNRSQAQPLTGAVLTNPGTTHYKRLDARATDRRQAGQVRRGPHRTIPALQAGEEDVVVYTTLGWRIVDNDLWSLTTQRMSVLEPGFMPRLIDFFFSMIPGTWPDWAQRRVESAVRTIDPRVNPVLRPVHSINRVTRLYEGCYN